MIAAAVSVETWRAASAVGKGGKERLWALKHAACSHLAMVQLNEA